MVLFVQKSLPARNSCCMENSGFIYVKNPLAGNMSARLRRYRVLLFKFRRHSCKGILFTDS